MSSIWFKRWYTAHWEEGGDHGEFDFFSMFNANSRRNIEDAEDESKRRYGYRKTIVRTHLKDSW